VKLALVSLAVGLTACGLNDAVMPPPPYCAQRIASALTTQYGPVRGSFECLTSPVIFRFADDDEIFALSLETRWDHAESTGYTRTRQAYQFTLTAEDRPDSMGILTVELIDERVSQFRIDVYTRKRTS
jgi:hypothetical protein